MHKTLTQCTRYKPGKSNWCDKKIKSKENTKNKK